MDIITKDMTLRSIQKLLIDSVDSNSLIKKIIDEVYSSAFLYAKSLGRKNYGNNYESEQTTMDIFQEAMVKFIQILMKHNFDDKSLDISANSYFYALIRYEFKKLDKRMYRHQDLSESDIENFIENNKYELDLNFDEVNIIERSIVYLSLPCRDFLEMLLIKEMTVDEIVDKLSISKDQFYMQKSRCIKHLRQLLINNGYAE